VPSVLHGLYVSASVRNCDKSTLQSKARDLSFSLELGYFVTLLVTT
jgi:hypothetical protein